VRARAVKVAKRFGVPTASVTCRSGGASTRRRRPTDDLSLTIPTIAANHDAVLNSATTLFQDEEAATALLGASVWGEARGSGGGSMAQATRGGERESWRGSSAFGEGERRGERCGERRADGVPNSGSNAPKGGALLVGEPPGRLHEPDRLLRPKLLAAPIEIGAEPLPHCGGVARDAVGRGGRAAMLGEGAVESCAGEEGRAAGESAAGCGAGVAGREEKVRRSESSCSEKSSTERASGEVPIRSSEGSGLEKSCSDGAWDTSSRKEPRTASCLVDAARLPHCDAPAAAAAPPPSASPASPGASSSSIKKGSSSGCLGVVGHARTHLPILHPEW